LKVKPVKPDFLLKDVEELAEFFELLYCQLGVRGILYDLERTLVPVGCRELPEQRMYFLRFMASKGFVQGLCTNSSALYDHSSIAEVFGNRVAQPNELHAIKKKPDPSIFRRGVSLLGLCRHEILMVGDKLLFDTSPAAALGMKTALVNPMPGKDVWAEYLAFRRSRERLALRQLGVQRP
jgi:predicted HAD superfamily phosphohydrolase YqeG